MKKKLLFVDDEPQVLKALVRTFMETDYEICTAESGVCALKILGQEDVDLIITDMRMPNMDGYQLLCEVKEKHPNVLRIILSGYSDEGLIFKALLRNVAKLYAFKPWENDKLIKSVDQIFETEELLKNKNLLTLINNIDELPALKSNYQRILSSIDNNEEIDDISNLIEKDQSIATKLLHVVNSACYGVKTGSVKHAVTYLGLSNLRNLILSTSVVETLGTFSIPEHLLKGIWDHAFITNRVLNFLYHTFLKKKLPETSMSAGLLHNIGIVLLLSCYKEEYVKCMKKAQEDNTDVEKLENQFFGISHYQTGGYLLKWWDLPFPIVESALYHNAPLNDSIVNKELLYGLHIAERYASKLLNKPPEGKFLEETFSLLGIDPQEFEERLHQSVIIECN